MLNKTKIDKATVNKVRNKIGDIIGIFIIASLPTFASLVILAVVFNTGENSSDAVGAVILSFTITQFTLVAGIVIVIGEFRKMNEKIQKLSCDKKEDEEPQEDEGI